MLKFAMGSVVAGVSKLYKFISNSYLVPLSIFLFFSNDGLSGVTKKSVYFGVTLEKHQYYNLYQSRQSISVLDIDLSKDSISVVFDGNSTKRQTVSSFAQENKAIGAINGSFFYLSNISKIGSPNFIRINGRTLNNDGAFIGKPLGNAGIQFEGGKLSILKRPNSGTWRSLDPLPRSLITCGPLLVDNGNIVSELQDSGYKMFEDRNPRSAVCITKDNHLKIFTIDGRNASGNAAGMTIVEVAKFLKSQNCRSGFNLDGGGSSTLWVKGQIVNNTAQNNFHATDEREVANAILIKPLRPKFRFSSSGKSLWIDINRSSIPLENLRFGDFNGDGKTDVFTKIDNQWKYSSEGKSKWINLEISEIPIEYLRFGDFNGDGKTDVFTKWGNRWMYSSAGKSKWINLEISEIPIEYLRFGDFNGDGKTDVFTKIGNQWKYSSGGKSKWINLTISTQPLSNLRFGDFNGDGKTDVFTKIDNQWKYSSGGKSKWINLTISTQPLSNLRFGDFNGDGKTDVFTKIDNQWNYSSGARSSWRKLNRSSVKMKNLRFGDFDGDGKTDVFMKQNY